MSGVVEGLISDLVAKGMEKLASRKRLTSQDLTVLLLHQQGATMSRMGKELEDIAGELKELRREVVPLLGEARDIAEIRSRVERIEAKVG